MLAFRDLKAVWTFTLRSVLRSTGHIWHGQSARLVLQYKGTGQSLSHTCTSHSLALGAVLTFLSHSGFELFLQCATSDGASYLLEQLGIICSFKSYYYFCLLWVRQFLIDLALKTCFGGLPCELAQRDSAGATLITQILSLQDAVV